MLGTFQDQYVTVDIPRIIHADVTSTDIILKLPALSLTSGTFQDRYVTVHIPRFIRADVTCTDINLKLPAV